MPSDAKKKKEQQKKEARKKKDIKKPANSGKPDEDDQDDDEQQDDETQQVNGEENGDNGTAPAQTNGATTAKPKKNPFDMAEMKKHFDHVLEVEKMNADNRACTGVLASHPNGRDTHIHQFSLTFYGQELCVSGEKRN